ncbi:MAG: hypothetical protein F6K19_06060 [Cyanothece sp. SIO1E1]|nr:hypothetical protein [Cyanothece sp. SIO1E1]
MPLEIRELVIRTSVAGDRPQSSHGASSGSLSEETQAAIVAACVDQVLSILQTRSER